MIEQKILEGIMLKLSQKTLVLLNLRILTNVTTASAIDNFCFKKLCSKENCQEVGGMLSGRKWSSQKFNAYNLCMNFNELPKAKVFYLSLDCTVVNPLIILGKESCRLSLTKSFTHVNFKLEFVHHLIAAFLEWKRTWRNLSKTVRR